MPELTIDKLPDYDAILLRIPPGVQWTGSARGISARVTQLLDQAAAPVYVIVDLTGNNPTVQEIVVAANIHAKPTDAWTHHPMLRELLVVSEKTIVGVSARGLSSDAFGKIRVRVFANYQNALRHVEANGGHKPPEQEIGVWEKLKRALR